MNYIIVPTYNEADNITLLIDKVLELDCNLHVVVVDDNSPDGTGEIVSQYSQRDSCVELIHNPCKVGLGRAYLRGFQHIRNRDFDQVIKMDADLSHRPEYIPHLIKAGRRSDLVIGSRYISGGCFDASWGRRVLSRLANLFASYVLSVGVHDSTTGFHCLSRRMLETVLSAGLVSHGFALQAELVFLARQANLTVEEVPIRFAPREEGSSKMSLEEIGRGAIDLIKLRLR